MLFDAVWLKLLHITKMHAHSSSLAKTTAIEGCCLEMRPCAGDKFINCLEAETQQKLALIAWGIACILERG